MRDRAEHVCICYVFLMQIGGGGGYIGLQLETAICRDWLTEDKIRPTPHAESNSWTKLMLKVCAINSLERLLLRDSLNADNDSWTVMTHLCSSNKLKAIFSRQTEREAPSQFTHAMDQRKYIQWGITSCSFYKCYGVEFNIHMFDVFPVVIPGNALPFPFYP